MQCRDQSTYPIVRDINQDAQFWVWKLEENNMIPLLMPQAPISWRVNSKAHAAIRTGCHTKCQPCLASLPYTHVHSLSKQTIKFKNDRATAAMIINNNSCLPFAWQMGRGIFFRFAAFSLAVPHSYVLFSIVWEDPQAGQRRTDGHEKPRLSDHFEDFNRRISTSTLRLGTC